MDDADIRNSAKFLIDRHGVEEAKRRAAQRALDVADSNDRAAWLRILQATSISSRRPGPTRR